MVMLVRPGDDVRTTGKLTLPVCCHPDRRDFRERQSSAAIWVVGKMLLRLEAPQQARVRIEHEEAVEPPPVSGQPVSCTNGDWALEASAISAEVTESAARLRQSAGSCIGTCERALLRGGALRGADSGPTGMAASRRKL